MRRTSILAIAGLAIAACTLPQQATMKADAVAAGQLFCAVRTFTGPMTVTILNAAGIPVIVTGMASNVVAAWCKSWDAAAIPVVPAVGPVPAVAVPAIAPAPMAAPVPVK